MLGGDEAVIDEIRPELEAISTPGRLFMTGPIGSASTIKMLVLLCLQVDMIFADISNRRLNQHLAGTHVVAAAETLAFAKAIGLSSRDAYRALMNSEGGSWIMGDRGLSMLSGDFSPKSAVTIFTKDMVGSLKLCNPASKSRTDFHFGRES